MAETDNSFTELLRSVVEDRDLIVTFELEPRNSLWANGLKFVCTLSPDSVVETTGAGADLPSALADALSKLPNVNRVVLPAEPPPSPQIIDLMEALKASLKASAR